MENIARRDGGATGMAAAIICWARQHCSPTHAVKDWLTTNSVPGRVRYYGCPAEEGKVAKLAMVRSAPS